MLDSLSKNNKYEVYDFLVNESEKLDKSHRMMMESGFKSNFPELYAEMMSDERLTKFKTFKQKLWHFFNDDFEIHKCPVCGSELKLISIKKGYRKYCSSKCKYKDPDYLNKVSKQTKSMWRQNEKKSEISKSISEGRKKYWENKTPESRKELTNHLRNAKMMSDMNRTESEWNDIKNKQRESWRKTWESKSDEEKESITQKRLESYKETIKNRTDVDRKRVSENIKSGLKNMSNDRKSRHKSNNHNSRLKKIQETNPEILEVKHRTGTKNPIYTCVCQCESCGKCSSKTFKITYASYIYRKNHNIEICPILHPRTVGISSGEKELLEYIRQIYDGPIIENDRIVLNGKEIDIYLPELKLGFEFQGDMWHCNPLLFDESFVNPINNKTYSEIHKNDELKKQLAREIGVKIVEIWEIDWFEHNRKTKEQIRNYIRIS